MKKITAYLILVFILMSCQDPASPLGSDQDGEIELKFGQKVLLPEQDVFIRFSDLLEDSRCPKLVQCVWAGNAQIALTVNNTEYLINTTLEPRKITIMNYTVDLLALVPYPVSNQEIDKTAYTAKLSFTRK